MVSRKVEGEKNEGKGREKGKGKRRWRKEGVGERWREGVFKQSGLSRVLEL